MDAVSLAARHPLAVGAVVVVLVGIFGIGVIGCQYGRVSDQDLLAAVDAGRPPRILDVRTSAEFARGHLPGAEHLPYHLVWRRGSMLPRDREAPIVVYCLHGPRAVMAALQLSGLGYSNVALLQGHMAKWKRRGQPMEAEKAEKIAPDGDPPQDR